MPTSCQLFPHYFSDHYNFKAEDLKFSDGDRVLMTEKDAVKCRSFATENMWYLSVDAVVSKTLLTQISVRLSGLLDR